MDRILKKIVWLVIIAPVIYLLIVWNDLPSTVPIHYNFQGEPDRYGNKSQMWFVLGLITVVNILVYLLLTNVHRFDPSKKAIKNIDKNCRLAFAISLFMSVISTVIVYYTAHSESKFNSNLILTGVGLLFAFVGNYMYTIKPNYFAGFRLRWTLTNEENWRKTHLLGGKLWFAGGLLIAMLSLILPGTISFIVVGVILLTIIIIPGLYSYRLYKNQSKTIE
jgi:uncharacterized membrane protein